MSSSKVFFMFLSAFLFTLPLWAAHPMITDDSGTQGKGNIQLELTAEYSVAKEDGVKTKTFSAPTLPVLSIGVRDNVDVVSSISWQHIKTDGQKAVRGAGDLTIDVKWRFKQYESLSFALKPGTSLPTADEHTGLGNGKAAPHIYFIATKELGDFTTHLNIGYLLNNNNNEERKNILQASSALEWHFAPKLCAAFDAGIESRRSAAERDPLFALIGFVWSLNDNFDFDAGVKKLLNTPQTETALLAGFTSRF